MKSKNLENIQVPFVCLNIMDGGARAGTNDASHLIKQIEQSMFLFISYPHTLNVDRQNNRTIPNKCMYFKLMSQTA